jgi:hypothetical protein
MFDVADFSNILLTLLTSVTVLVALIQYLRQKDKEEQARFISIYAIRLFDVDEYLPLEIAPAGSKLKAKSLAIALMIENNSNQPIYDFNATINTDAFRDAKGALPKTKDGNEIIIADRVGWKKDDEWKPFKMIPPGKWLISLDFTDKNKDKDTDGDFQGMNLLDSTLKYDNADYLPVVRTNIDAVSSYEFKDNMRVKWRYKDDKLSKYRGRT